MKVKRFFMDPRTIFIISVIFLCLAASAPVLADDEQDTDETPSYFNNAAQAQKARNIAEAETVQNDEGVNQALSELDNAEATGDETAIAEAQAAVDQAIADAIASAMEDGEIDDIKDDIADKRAEGMGWGQIAHEYGIQPSVLGNRYGQRSQIQAQTQNQNRNRNRNKERAAYGYGKKAGVMSSTMRNLRTGGNAYGKSKGNQGLGKGANNAGGVGKANGKGNAGGKGNNGNHGSGNNGNGKGNGKSK